MKKGQVYEGTIEKVEFPNKGIVSIDGEEKTILVKNGIPGQKIRFCVNKMRKGKAEGRLLEVLENSPLESREPVCSIFPACGGCMYQTMSYEEQLRMKENQIKEILDAAIIGEYDFEGIKASPKEFSYRNKMEYSFGDEYKDGPISLGLHKKGSTYDVLVADDCKLVHEDMNKILRCVLQYFRERNVSYYKKMQHEGYLRHLLLRRGDVTGEILVNLVTTTQEDHDLTPLAEAILALDLEGKIVGILHILNDSLSDVVKSDETRILYGQDYFYEKLLGMEFKITPFSFFQPNSRAAEVLYSTVREYLGDMRGKTLYDLFSGTGTIGQILSPVAGDVIGVEIVEEAVKAANENARHNRISNCRFLAGDVFQVLDEIEEKPDVIVLDPPRDGIHPKALPKILNYGVDTIVYISCKVTSLARDLEMMQANGYRVVKAVAVDQFVHTVHVETVVLMKKQSQDLTQKYEFRDIRSDEIAQAVAIEQICFPPHEACSEKSMSERIRKVPELFMVAVDKQTGKIAGFLNGIATDEEQFRDEFFTDADLYNPKGKNVMLLGLDVLPEHRGQGLAREIINQYRKREQENNRSKLILTCLESKVEMYLKMGFCDLGISNSTWGNEEWHEMSLDITN